MDKMVIKGVCKTIITVDRSMFPDVHRGCFFTVEEIDDKTGEITTHVDCPVESIDEFAFTVLVA